MPGFVLGCAVFFSVSFARKAGVSFDEAGCEEDFSEFHGKGRGFSRMLVFTGR